MKKYGFVYIWRDKKHNRYYIGRHWGHINDGYICSSSWMKQAYSRRPLDFKRKILKIVSTKTELVSEENYFLSKIKAPELGKRYYNLHNKTHEYWYDNEDSKKSTGQKISKALTGRKQSLETKAKRKKTFEAKGIKFDWNKGRKYSLEEIESRKKNRKDPWNKGLSKDTDPRVRKYIENSAKTRREKSKND